MSAVTVACVWVQGEYPYTAEYVTRLEAMVRRWIDRPYRFICLTDRPGDVPNGWAVPIQKRPGLGCWSKIALFAPARQWSGRMLYLDLDTLIVGPLAPIIDAPASFAITDDPASLHRHPKTTDRFGHQIIRKFNSSVMVWDGGTHTELETAWSPAVTTFLSTDQDWIAQQLPDAHALPRLWFPRLSELDICPPPPPAKVVLVKVPKNAIAAQQHPWLKRLWG